MSGRAPGAVPGGLPAAPGEGGVRAWLLDLDGTLVDTHDANVAAYLEALAAALPGAHIDPAGLRRRIVSGESCAGFVPALVPGATPADVAAVAAAKRGAYPRHLGLTRLNAALAGRVRAWRAGGGAAALVTTAKEANARAVLAHHGLGGLFDLCVFGDGVARLKPAPDIYLGALARLGLPAPACLALEDSEAGVAAARAAGIAVLRVGAW